MLMAPGRTPKPTPNLAESERSEDDTGTEVNIVGSELITVFVPLTAVLVVVDSAMQMRSI